MNIQEYIQSGIIELYVMNVLTEAEQAEVEVLARQYPDIQLEIEEVQSVLQMYAQAHSVTPPPELKDPILDKIQSTINKAESTEITENTDLNNIKNTPTLSLAILTPWLLAAALTASTFYFYNKYETANKAQKECEEIQKLNEQKNKKAIADVQQQLDILKSPDTKEISLKGLPISPSSIVTIFWNADKKATYIAIRNLPKPPSDKQYQLWAIVDKKPVSAGVLNYDLAGLQAMKGFETAEAFAITLEPEGGSDAPTLDKMYVLGTP
jgi:anti-sigma-K factor RskA